jgi:hypothetical protein
MPLVNNLEHLSEGNLISLPIFAYAKLSMDTLGNIILGWNDEERKML